MKIELGKRYIRRDGLLSGKIECSGSEGYTLIDRDNEATYTSEGLWIEGRVSHKDLVSTYLDPEDLNFTLDRTTLNPKAYSIEKRKGYITVPVGYGIACLCIGFIAGFVLSWFFDFI